MYNLTLAASVGAAFAVLMFILTYKDKKAMTVSLALFATLVFIPSLTMLINQAYLLFDYEPAVIYNKTEELERQNDYIQQHYGCSCCGVVP